MSSSVVEQTQAPSQSSPRQPPLLKPPSPRPQAIDLYHQTRNQNLSSSLSLILSNDQPSGSASFSPSSPPLASQSSSNPPSHCRHPLSSNANPVQSSPEAAPAIDGQSRSSRLSGEASSPCNPERPKGGSDGPSNSTGSGLLDMSTLDEDSFLVGLDDEIAQVAAPIPDSPRVPPRVRRSNVIDLTLSDSPPTASSSSAARKRRLQALQPPETIEVTKKPKPAAADPSDVDSNSLVQQNNESWGCSHPVNELTLNLDEELSCPICCDLLVAPVNFPCGHAFCGSCAHQWLEKENVCPTCRQEPLSAPARMYVLDATIQKYFQHQLDRLRREGKLSEALAVEMERQERVDQWTVKRKTLEGFHSRARDVRYASIANRRHPHRYPVNLPQVAGFELFGYPAPHNGRSFELPRHPIPRFDELLTGHYDYPRSSGMSLGRPPLYPGTRHHPYQSPAASLATSSTSRNGPSSGPNHHHPAPHNGSTSTNERRNRHHSSVEALHFFNA